MITPRRRSPGGWTSFRNLALIRSAVDTLPAHYRITIILKDLEGLSYQEIADILGIPLGTVKSRINFGKRLLRKTLRAFLDDAPL